MTAYWQLKESEIRPPEIPSPKGSAFLADKAFAPAAGWSRPEEDY